MPVSEQTFKQVALEDPEGHWELHCGELRSKPGMTEEHNDLSMELAYLLRHQLKRSEFRVRQNTSHVRRSELHYYTPDVTVLPAEAALQQRGTGKLETYSVPLPLVIEIWSRSTGDYDV
ncbi:MAG: Uma2 family endonuclease, partial [Dehalococcoidia bacterium]